MFKLKSRCISSRCSLPLQCAMVEVEWKQQSQAQAQRWVSAEGIPYVMCLRRPDPGTSLVAEPVMLRHICVPQMRSRSSHAREGYDEKMCSLSLRIPCLL